jgi:dsRNA-specific ribonuclease
MICSKNQPQTLNALQQLQTVNVQLTSQQLLWLLEEFGEDVAFDDALKRLVNRTMKAQYRARNRKAEADVAVVQLPAKGNAESPQPKATPWKKEVQVSSQLTATVPVQENAIGALQERCQQQGQPLPEYNFKPIAQGFQCEVHALGLTTESTGPAKQVAKHQAARRLLEKLG